tara:strand:+ start:8512 stop:8832 length:321 start_codon:yes stop_codon:yes gene_type:complete
MKNIKFEYNKTIELQSLIEDVYFSEENNGKLPLLPKKHLILDENNLYYQVLTGLDYMVRIRNTDLIDGSMDFSVIEKEDTIELVPFSKYCIKTSNNKDKKEKYSFY